jgi:hypothetical protein
MERMCEVVGGIIAQRMAQLLSHEAGIACMPQFSVVVAVVLRGDTGIRSILACRQHNRRYGIHEEAKR